MKETLSIQVKLKYNFLKYSKIPIQLTLHLRNKKANKTNHNQYLINYAEKTKTLLINQIFTVMTRQAVGCYKKD